VIGWRYLNTSHRAEFTLEESRMKKILAAVMAFFAMLSIAFAAVDANTASQADLETIKGIGPAISARIVEERKKGGPFKDASDLEQRVKGVGEENIKKMMAAGLTVGGKGAAAAAPKADAKADAKKETPKADMKADAKADAKKDAPKADMKADAKADAKKDTPKADMKADAKKDTPKADMKADAKKDEKKADAKKDEKKADAKKDDKKADAKKDDKKDEKRRQKG
jgi:competence protein ComEA